MRAKLIIFSLITVLSNAVYAGDIFRCVAANGDVMFTNMACPANSQVQHVASYEPVPDVPAATYNTPANAAAASPVQAHDARAAYQAGYEQAQAEAQDEQPSGETEYAGGWIPFYPLIRPRFHDDHHHHHPRQVMAAHTSHIQSAIVAPHR
jgi:hypothetical protein